MASRHWLEANSKRSKGLQRGQQQQQRQEKTSLCWDVVGSPSAWPTAGFKPRRYCLEPCKEKSTTQIRWSEFLYFDASPECEARYSSSSTTLFAPRSFAPPRQEAEELNPLCKYDKRPGTSVFLSTYERSLAQGKKHREAVAAAVESRAVLADQARKGAESSREFLAAARNDEGVSQTNDEPVRWSDQLRAVVEALGHAMG